MKIVCDLNDWFSSKLASLRCKDETRAYVISVMVDFQSTNTAPVFQNSSFVLEYSDAVKKYEFSRLQSIGDSALFLLSIEPQREHNAVISDIGMRSYDACDKLLKREWEIFGELSNKLNVISRDVNLIIGDRDEVASHVSRLLVRGV